MVITELDFLKDSQNLKERQKKIVFDSIKFINTLLTERSEKVVGKYLEQFYKYCLFILLLAFLLYSKTSITKQFTDISKY